MAFIGKTYAEVKSENIEAFVKSLKVPDDIAGMIIKSKTKQKLDKNGDEYVLTSHFNDMPVVLKFKNGVEFEETVGPNDVTMTASTFSGTAKRYFVAE